MNPKLSRGKNERIKISVIQGGEEGGGTLVLDLGSQYEVRLEWLPGRVKLGCLGLSCHGKICRHNFGLAMTLRKGGDEKIGWIP